MAVNYSKLHGEILAAGVAIDGVASVVGEPLPEWIIFTASDNEVLRVDFQETPDQLIINAVQTIIDAHDPTDYVQQVKDAAEGHAAAVPGWASWTEVEALSWHQTNLKDLLDSIPDDVTNLELAQLKQVIQQMLDVQRNQVALARAMIRMVVALRNENWPRLQGS